MTRVLVIEPAGGLWGSERALIDLIEAAPELEVAVCCPPGTPLQAELAARGVAVLPYFIAELHRKSKLRRLQAAAGVLRACLAFRPDVIHINQSGAYRTTLPAARLLGLPIVSHVRIFEDAAYLAACRPDPRRLKGLIAISGAIEDEIAAFPALAAIPTHRIYDAYAPAPPPAEAPQRVAGRIACVGRVTPIKGQAVLLAAMALVQDAECLIVGDGDADHVRALKEESPANVRWTGFVREIAPLLRTCKVLACPSHREPLGRVIFEAWDAGAVPVVYVGAGGSAEIVAASAGGIVYEEQTPQGLAEALAAALALDDKEAARMIDNGRAWMAANCGPKAYGRAIAKVLAAA